MAIHTPETERNIPKESKVNVFLQTWKTLRGLKAPKSTQKLLKLAQRYRVRPEGIEFSPEIRRQMPMWYHIDGDPKLRRLNHSATSRCLRISHGAITVGEIEKLAKVLNDEDHLPTAECPCNRCTRAVVEVNCANPHECFTRVKALLDTLSPKWHPDTKCIEEDDQGMVVLAQTTPFNRLAQVNGSLAKIFRAFTEGEGLNDSPEIQEELNNHNITIITATIDTISFKGTSTTGIGVFF